MNQRLTWTLCAVVGASVLGTALLLGQAPDCEPATRACFDIRVDLPIAAEPSPRKGYERPTVNRYQSQELETYRQLRMDQTPYTCATIGGEEGLSNRDEQEGTDVEHNQCWFAGRVIAVKQRWGLFVDEREAQFLKTALAGCTPEQIARPVCEASEATTTTGNSAEAWLARCDANGNGRVTCAEARAESCGAPIPVTSDHPLYQFMTDADGDGQVCE